MNITNKFFPKSEKNKIIILTLEINKPHLNIDEFKNFEIMNCYELLEKQNYDSLNDSNEKRIEYIANEIINSKINILICDVCFSITDFDKISELLKPNKLIINKILVPNESKRKSKLLDGQEIYRNHSRWLDFYPGQIEEIHEEFEMKIKNKKNKYHESIS
ncbi:hypothetical protein [Flavobacterium columnare]|uniref:hypothetical protein n=1 Tax=Flavobacterium columnare TaxID=996 RepID=UPI003B9F9F38